MTLTNDEIAFLRREAQVANNTFSCADMLRVLDALAETRARAAQDAEVWALFDDGEESTVDKGAIEVAIRRIREAVSGRKAAEARAEKAEADAAAMREALAAVKRQALYCLEHSGEERDDAVRDLDLVLAHPGFATDAGVKLLAEVECLRAEREQLLVLHNACERDIDATESCGVRAKIEASKP